MGWRGKPLINFNGFFYIKTKKLYYISMTIFRPNLAIQNVTVIPRYNAPIITLNLKNEGLGTFETFNNINTTYSNGYCNFEFEKQVQEGANFEIEIKDGITTIFRGKAFATDETDLQNYKING